MGMYILCPFYKRDRKKSITCEDTIRSYPSVKEKNEVLKRLCSSRWKDCPYAKRMSEIYSQDIPCSVIKERIMENTIEQQKAEINKLMRENGQLKKKLEVLKDQLDDRDRVATKNHEMYMKSLNTKKDLLEAKDKQIEWLESFAAAFLVVAYGENTREVHMSQEKVLKLMTEYKMEYSYDQDTKCWVFSIDSNVKGEKS